MADRGTAITASDVVAAAEVSNGTFYNHFVDLDDFVREVARQTFLGIADAAAVETAGAKVFGVEKKEVLKQMRVTRASLHFARGAHVERHRDGGNGIRFNSAA